QMLEQIAPSSPTVKDGKLTQADFVAKSMQTFSSSPAQTLEMIALRAEEIGSSPLQAQAEKLLAEVNALPEYRDSVVSGMRMVSGLAGNGDIHPDYGQNKQHTEYNRQGAQINIQHYSSPFNRNVAQANKATVNIIPTDIGTNLTDMPSFEPSVPRTRAPTTSLPISNNALANSLDWSLFNFTNETISREDAFVKETGSPSTESILSGVEGLGTSSPLQAQAEKLLGRTTQQQQAERLRQQVAKLESKAIRDINDRDSNKALAETMVLDSEMPALAFARGSSPATAAAIAKPSRLDRMLFAYNPALISRPQRFLAILLEKTKGMGIPENGRRPEFITPAEMSAVLEKLDARHYQFLGKELSDYMAKPQRQAVLHDEVVSWIGILQAQRQSVPPALTYIKEYIDLYAQAQGKRIELSGPITPSDIKTLAKAISSIPANLARQIRVPVRLNFTQLPAGIAGRAGVDTIGMIRMNDNRLQRIHDYLHELLHKFTASSNRNGQPVISVSQWKQLAKAAGFYGAFINGNLIPVENIPDSYSYKALRRISYGEWVRNEGGRLVSYLPESRRNEIIAKSASAFSRYNITIKEGKNHDYWKTTPFEAVAEVGADLLERPQQFSYGLGPERNSVAQLLRRNLFVTDRRAVMASSPVDAQQLQGTLSDLIQKGSIDIDVNHNPNPSLAEKMQKVELAPLVDLFTQITDDLSPEQLTEVDGQLRKETLALKSQLQRILTPEERKQSRLWKGLAFLDEGISAVLPDIQAHLENLYTSS
ncbi:MAG: hypothetical protein ACOY3D_07255, partial [Candidatus Omnitrophota bacterium]